MSSPNVASILEDELKNATVLEQHQPSPGLIERIEARPSLDEPGVEGLDMFSRTDYPYRLTNVVMKDGIPYYPYYALKSGSNHVVHPMALGRFLLRNASGAKAKDTAEAIMSLAHNLPNGGLAWYYPRHYKVARMMGEHLKFSSIAQGTIITGLTQMFKLGVIDGQAAKQAFQAMLWPFEKNGINLADLAVLEMPSFSGPPEIILNGWIDALLHIRDYAAITGDAQALEFFQNNVKFLAEILPNFDAREAQISRYSDMSPYRVKVRLASAKDIDTLEVYYRPKRKGLPAIRVPLKITSDPNNFSVYENQILRTNNREAFVWLSCSQLYETVIVSRSREMTVIVNKGVIDRKSSAPGVKGEELQLESEQSGDLRSVTISAETGMICGYPTNFAKGGIRNYYHSYHVVGLMLVGMSAEINASDRETILGWALKWKADMDHIEKEEKLEFRALPDMLGDINGNQAEPRYTDFAVLLSDVQSAMKQRLEAVE